MIKVGMIGCGGISRGHVAGWQTVDSQKARVVATADIDEAAAKERAEALGAEDVYDDYLRLLDRDDIDAVDICLPHPLHMESTVAAAKHGKHVLCEKPIARDLEEAQRMIDVCKEHGRILQIGHQNRFSPEFMRYKELLGELDLGKINLVQSRWEFWPNLRPFHYKKDAIGGGTLISCGIHTADLARWFWGDVKTVAFMGNSFTRGMEGEDVAALLLEFADGPVGTLIMSWACKFGKNTWFSSQGPNGALEVERGKPVVQTSEDGATEYPATVDVPAMGGQKQHFVECIAEGKTPLVSGEEGYKALQIALAAYESMETGRIIDIA